VTFENADEPGRIIRFHDLRERFGITWSRMHVDRLEKAGQFPGRVSLGGNTVGWIEAEILAWLRAKMAARASRPGEAA
jgi:prophage regulatory protein